MFVAGLTRMQAIGWEELRGRKVKEEDDYQVWQNVDSGYEVTQDGELIRVWPFVVQCLYEAQDTGSCVKVFGQSRVDYYGQDQITLFDAYAVGYCVSLCTNDWNVELRGTGLGPEMVKMLMYGLKSVKYGGGSLNELGLSGNPIKDEGVKYLHQFPHQILQQMRTLHLSYCGLGQTGFELLADAIPLLSSLESLHITGNPGGNGSTVKLLHALGEHQTVEKLRMEGSGNGMDDIIALSEVVQPSRSLKKLATDIDNMSSECVQQLMRTVFSPSSLRELTVRVPSGVYPLNYIGTISNNLATLEFWSPGASSKQPSTELSGKGGITLSNILKENTTLKELLLDIPLEKTEVWAIIESLKYNNSITTLELSRKYHFQYLVMSEQQALDHRIVWRL